MEEDSQIRTPECPKRTPEPKFDFSYSSQENPGLLERDSDLVEDAASLLISLSKDEKEINLANSSLESGGSQSSKPHEAPSAVREDFDCGDADKDSNFGGDSEDSQQPFLMKVLN